MTTAQLRLFVSTVSSEFRSYRDRLREDLKGPLLEVKVQEDFIQMGGDTLSLLDDYVTVCDAVIHLVGDAAGACPAPASVEALLRRRPDFLARVPAVTADVLSRLSYTQWEAYLALYHGKLLFLYQPTPDAKRDDEFAPDTAQKESQDRHRLRLQSLDRWAAPFLDTQGLSTKVFQSLLGQRWGDRLAAEVSRMPLAYPPPFTHLLARDHQLRDGLETLVVRFGGWLRSGRAPFFPDYTDHGIGHLEKLLATAAQLVTGPAWEEFTPADTAVATAATLFHDAALHTSEAGFYDLIRGRASKWAVREFVGDRPWPELWDEFLFSAKRWDERRLREVLGENPDGQAHVRDPFADYDNLTATDRKLIGEFIRRHQPRMAHEFAVNGVPGRDLIEVSGALGEDFRDLAGLVARSHGLPIRACLPYLDSRYHRREYSGVHAVYLMTLQRLADFLRIRTERAPAIVFQYRHIPSEKMELEWKAHKAIRNVTRTDDDPESIWVQADPADVHTYLRLKDWLAGIQSELDASWAVLGETYGLQPSLRKLGPILRRVRSNLDDQTRFARSVRYVPERIELAVARPDLLKLLVGPLYDNIPSIGIRELMQNAVDAVRERLMLQELHPELRNIPLIQQDHDVEIRVGPPDEKGAAWLVVSDRGVGMTAETIRDYFLTAGASFRTSDAWKREFETDDAPRSRVLRSGRFGVGVLAGFLLGPRMDVTTRHIRAGTGIRFSTTMDLHAIELRHDPTAPVGTEVRIPISGAVRQKLLESEARVIVPEKFDWFVFDSPTIGRFVGDVSNKKVKPSRRRRQRKVPDLPASVIEGSQRVSQQYAVRQPTPSQPSEFRLLRGEHGCSVYWTYRPMPALTVNGIFITDSGVRSRFSQDLQGRHRRRRYSWDRANGLEFDLRFPHVCVEDADGTFPLNVRRSDITERAYPFESQLITDLIDDYLAYLLVHCPTRPTDFDAGWAKKHPGVEIRSQFGTGLFSLNLSPVCCTQAGMTLLFAPLRKQVRAKVIDLTISASDDAHAAGVFSQDGISVSVVGVGDREWPGKVADDDIPAMAVLDLYETLQMEGKEDELRRILLCGNHVRGMRCVVPARMAKKFSRPDKWIAERTEAYKRSVAENQRKIQAEEKIQKTIRNWCDRFVVEQTAAGYSVLATPGCPPTRWQPQAAQTRGAAQPVWVEIFLTEAPTPPAEYGADLISQRWSAILGQPLIPFDLAVRKRELASAYASLAAFIRAHEAMKEAGVLY